ISDRQLTGMPVSGHGTHQVLLLPPCNVMPLATLRRALELARGGATVLFQDRLPGDVSGLAQLEQRRAEFAQLVQSLRLPPAKSGENGKVQSVRFGRGKVLVGPLKPALTAAGVTRETLFDHPGLMCIRRRADSGTTYFVANRGDTPFDGWLPLARTAKSVVVLDPLTGQTGTTSVRRGKTSPIEARVQLRPGDALVLRESAARKLNGPVWKWWQADGRSEPLSGEWQVSFIDGGPELPAPFKTDQLASWTQLGDANAQRFAGPARYVIRFDAPTNAPAPGVYELDLGKVCQSARVRLNGVDLGTLFTPPFRVAAVRLAPTNNLLEVEVTNTDANRIRDLDRRGVQWKSYHDINFVNLDYRPFDASNWPLADAGLLGPVTLTPVTAVQP
ncbi:MAG TPA: glycoside hydrolase, partial [Verrucomicrobiae bacterium]|nr:glycoside hydrolase [Verrucomicrobiae bacterium]